MSKTCADCKYHECSSYCVKRKNTCNGWCTKKRIRKQCQGSRCKSFVLDDFFRNYDL